MSIYSAGIMNGSEGFSNKPNRITLIRCPDETTGPQCQYDNRPIIYFKVHSTGNYVYIICT